MHKKLKKKGIQYALLIEKHTMDPPKHYFIKIKVSGDRYVCFYYGRKSGSRLLCRIIHPDSNDSHGEKSLMLTSFLGQESHFLLLLQAVQDWIATCRPMTLCLGGGDCIFTKKLEKLFDRNHLYASYGSTLFVGAQLPTNYATLRAGTISYEHAFLVILKQQNKGMFGRVDKSVCHLLLSLLGKTSYVIEMVQVNKSAPHMEQVSKDVAGLFSYSDSSGD